MAEISRNIVKDGGELTQPHGKLRKTNPISKCLSHIYGMEAENLSNIHINSMRLEWCLQNDDRKLMWYLWWWQDAQPKVLYGHWGKTYKNDRRFEQALQWWQNTLWWQKTLYQFFGLNKTSPVLQLCSHMWQSFSITLTLLYSLQLMITMITTAGVKQVTNNSFTANNYSSTPTQHTKTGEWN